MQQQLMCCSCSPCSYVNEPKVKVDLTKYTERHCFRWGMLLSSVHLPLCLLLVAAGLESCSSSQVMANLIKRHC